MSAVDALARAIVTAVEHDEPMPCVGSPWWVSEIRTERETAAELCLTCPLVELCLAVAEEDQTIVHGVWGGHDFTGRKKNRSAATAAPTEGA